MEEEQETVAPKCFVCGKSGNVKLFSDSTLDKCKKSSLIRIKAAIRYSDVQVPENCDPAFGYHTRPCYSNFNSIKAKYLKATKIDVLWMVSHFLKIRTPMWVGFNSIILKHNSSKQKVSYLMPINKSPTDKSVVIETMRRALKIAEECKENYAQLTYDLGIAQIAMVIKSEEKDEFRKLFIHLGGFHITMAFFKVVGTFIDGCGLTTILIEAELLGCGSENSFINGKIYNRCKRLHILAALSLEILEFQFSLETKNYTINDDIKQYFVTLRNNQLDDMSVNNASVNDLLEQFLDFNKEVLQGYYGKAAQFYSQYINLIKYFLMFDRSIRMSNFDIYKYIMGKISNIFFYIQP